MSAGGIDARVAQLVTLPEASQAIKKPVGYFTIRRHRWREHATCPFPQPVKRIGIVDVYDLQTLLVWDEKRKTTKTTKTKETKHDDD